VVSVEHVSWSNFATDIQAHSLDTSFSLESCGGCTSMGEGEPMSVTSESSPVSQAMLRACS
jgi:hypothetical protein